MKTTKSKAAKSAEEIANGGELHQLAGGEVAALTTQQGTPVFDDQNSLRIGMRGPTALEDFHFREKIFHFDHERFQSEWCTLEFGAHGYFENYKPLPEITSADLFQRAVKRRRSSCDFPPWRATKAQPT